MVAYSFAPQFVEPVSTLSKLQTVRGQRKRHARPGVPIQLYAAMRTKHSRKLLSPDPVCVYVRHIGIEIDTKSPLQIAAIAIDSVPLDDDEIEAFAIKDGFGAALSDGWARQRMGAFWVKHHPWNRFDGVVIRWAPR